jgi:hypothetical protein
MKTPGESEGGDDSSGGRTSRQGAEKNGVLHWKMLELFLLVGW